MKKIIRIVIPEENRRCCFLDTPVFLDEQPQAVINLENQNKIKEAKKMLDLEPYHNNWDKIKKYTNDYELIHVSSNKKKNCENVAYYIPLSRSYFKMIEMLHDFDLLDRMSSVKPFTTAHLAEGPGGFIEAVVNKVKHKNRQGIADKFYGITLRSNSKEVPGWDKSSVFLNANPEITINYGLDNTGNLYNTQNLIYFANFIGRKCDLVTGDGGFDFSIDFNLQEIMSYRLILCQFIGALLLLKQGGHFVCKVFDTYTQFSIELLWLIAFCFEELNITKPLTSRPANSERYIVAKGFIPVKGECVIDYLLNLANNWNESVYLERILNNDTIHPRFLEALEEYNFFYYNNQIQIIEKTLYLITNCESLNYDKILKNQIKCAIKWCKKYGLQLNKNCHYFKT